MVALLALAAPLRAQSADPRYALPPAPSPQAPAWAYEVDLALVFPVATDGLCPPGAACLAGFGAGVSASVERRLGGGLALGGGYDLWFLDGGGVLDTTVVQSFRLGGRYLALADRSIHPTAGVAVGLLLLGESFRVATYGGLLELKGGVEVEVSETLAVTGDLGVRLATTAAFTSPADGVARSGGFEVDVALVARVGVVFVPAR